MVRAVLCLFVKMLTHGDIREENIFKAKKGYFGSLTSRDNPMHQSSEAPGHEPTYLLGELEGVMSRASSMWSADLQQGSALHSKRWMNSPKACSRQSLV